MYYMYLRLLHLPPLRFPLRRRMLGAKTEKEFLNGIFSRSFFQTQVLAWFSLSASFRSTKWCSWIDSSFLVLLNFCKSPVEGTLNSIEPKDSSLLATWCPRIPSQDCCNVLHWQPGERSHPEYLMTQGKTPNGRTCEEKDSMVSRHKNKRSIRPEIEKTNNAQGWKTQKTCSRIHRFCK